MILGKKTFNFSGPPPLPSGQIEEPGSSEAEAEFVWYSRKSLLFDSQAGLGFRPWLHHL